MLQAALDAGPSWNGHESCGSHQMSGTSMAAPAAAGTALLIRQFFMDKAFWAATCSRALPRCRAGAFVPSGYLVKAVFLHSGRGIARCGAVSQIFPAFPTPFSFSCFPIFFLSPNFHDASKNISCRYSDPLADSFFTTLESFELPGPPGTPRIFFPVSHSHEEK